MDSKHSKICWEIYLFQIVEGTVDILDDVEEWPEEAVEQRSNELVDDVILALSVYSSYNITISNLLTIFSGLYEHLIPSQTP